MEYVRLGSTGLEVSRLVLGCMSFGDPKRGAHPWSLDEESSRPLIRQAVEAGINFFDTANVYSAGSSEEIIGRAFKDFGRRDELVIATKVHGRMHDGPNGAGLSRKAIMAEVDGSLLRLDTDYIDLYQIHRWDPRTPIEETLEALHDVVKAGKARYIGASSMFAWQFAKAQHVAERHGWTRFVSMQNHYNLVYREEEREMIPLCLDQGIGLIPWSPMARGFFAGNRKREGGGETERANSDPFAKGLYFRDEDFTVADCAANVAKERGVTGSQIALAWILSKPHAASPIIGATKMEHLDQAIAALDIQLSEDEIKQLEESYKPHPVLGHS